MNQVGNVPLDLSSHSDEGDVHLTVRALLVGTEGLVGENEQGRSCSHGGSEEFPPGQGAVMVVLMSIHDFRKRLPLQVRGQPGDFRAIIYDFGLLI
jgi:hypothetical protein